MQLKGAPNVVQLLDCFYSTDAKKRVIQNTVLEYCDNNLENLLVQAEKKNEYIPWNTIKSFAL